jgi:hypothetical protein
MGVQLHQHNGTCDTPVDDPNVTLDGYISHQTHPVILPAGFVHDWVINSNDAHCFMETVSKKHYQLFFNDVHGLHSQQWWDHFILPMFTGQHIHIPTFSSVMQRVIASRTHHLSSFLATMAFINHPATAVIENLVDYMLSDGRVEFYKALRTASSREDRIVLLLVRLCPVSKRHWFAPSTTILSPSQYDDLMTDLQLPVGISLRPCTNRNWSATELPLQPDWEAAPGLLNTLFHRFNLDLSQLSYTHPTLAAGSVLCGGAVLRAALECKWPCADTDFFLFGTEEDCVHILQCALQYICNAPGIDVALMWHNMIMDVRVKHIDTDANLHMQFILRCFSSQEEVLATFDLDCCCLAYEPAIGHIMGLKRAFYSIANGTNILDVHYYTEGTSTRIAKYSERSFTTMIPMSAISRKEVMAAAQHDAAMFHEHPDDFQRKHGRLARVVATQCRPAGNDSFVCHQCNHILRYYGAAAQNSSTGYTYCCPWDVNTNMYQLQQYKYDHPTCCIWFRNGFKPDGDWGNWHLSTKFMVPNGDVPLLRWGAHHPVAVYRKGNDKMFGHIIAL